MYLVGLSLPTGMGFADDGTLYLLEGGSTWPTRPGEYVLWRGKVHGELSPAEAIPDLDKARRNEAGKVEYSSEVMLLMPADPSKGRFRPSAAALPSARAVPEGASRFIR